MEAFAPEIEDALEHPVDFKSALQERLARKGALVSYDVVDEEGPPHDRVFSVSATIDGVEVGRGTRPEQEGRRAGGRPGRAGGAGVRSAVYLKSIVLKGFKSFPDRTRLEFGPGVSVIVGPNGSGKSNVTDAVLWALGEQSPVAVRGQSMQDVIFGGAPGRQGARGAEVELVLDDSEGQLGLGAPEVSIVRRLDRGRRGRVPARRRALPAGRRDRGAVRHRARQGDALGHLPGPGRVDRHLQAARPADADRGGRRARQAPQAPAPRAAEARPHPGQPRPRARRRARGALAAAAAQAPGRGGRAARPPRAPDARGPLGARPRRPAVPPRRAHGQAQAAAEAARKRRKELERALDDGRRPPRGGRGGAGAAGAPTARSSRAAASWPSPPAIASPTAPRRCAAPGATLEQRLHADRGAAGPAARAPPRPTGPTPACRRTDRRARAGAGAARPRPRGRAGAPAGRARAAARGGPGRDVGEQADDGRADARRRASRRASGSSRRRGELREAERAVEAARREAARVGGELAACNQFLRSQTAAPGGAAVLADELEVDPGYELAVAAALDGRLRAAVLADRSAAGDAARPRRRRRRPRADRSTRRPEPDAAPGRRLPPPEPSGSPITSTGRRTTVALARRLLRDTWVVETSSSCPDGFAGVAVTRAGRVWSVAHARAAPGAGGRRGARARRAQPPRDADPGERGRRPGRGASPRGTRAPAPRRRPGRRRVRAGDRRAPGRGQPARRGGRERAPARRRRSSAGGRAPDDGPNAGRRMQLAAELGAARGERERAERERAERHARIERLEAAVERDEALLPVIERMTSALEARRAGDRRAPRASSSPR